MLLRTLGTVFLVLALPLVAAAQEKTIDELDKEVQDLKAQLELIKGELTKLSQADEDSQVKLDELINLVTEQTLAQKSALGVEGLKSNLQSEEFRHEMKKVVNDSLQDKGSVIINNRMTTQQTVKVNQDEHVILAGQSLTLNVPVGTLTAQLPGQSLTNWTITAPTYRQKIDIVPNERVTAYKPIENSTVTVLRPIESTTITAMSPIYTDVPVYTSTPIQSYYYDPFTGSWWPY